MPRDHFQRNLSDVAGRIFLYHDFLVTIDFTHENVKDNGDRVAFVYTGQKKYPEHKMDHSQRIALQEEQGVEIKPYDDRRWAMVDQGDGKGAKPVLIDSTSLSVELARSHGYSEKDYQPVGQVNLHTDILGYGSRFNQNNKPFLEGEALDKAVQEWYKRSYANDKKMMVDTEIESQEQAPQVRHDLEIRKGNRPEI